MKTSTELPDYSEWKATRPVEITVEIDAGDGRVFSNTFSSIEEMEMRIHRMEQAIELQLIEEYDEMVAAQEDEETEDPNDYRDNEENR